MRGREGARATRSEDKTSWADNPRPSGGFRGFPDMLGKGAVFASPGSQKDAERPQRALEILHEGLGPGGVDDDDVVAVDGRVLGLACAHLGQVVERRLAL